MRCSVAALLVAASLSAIALAQPLVTSAGATDVTALGSSLFLALENGTVVSLDGGLRWSFSTSDYGSPVHLEAAPPYGLIVLTDRAWLGLLALDGRISWLKLTLDPNSIKPTTSGLVYANGTALVHAGANAVFVSVPALRVVWTRSILNRFTDYSLSPSGSAALLAGFNTLCYVCVSNDEKIVVVHDIKSGRDLFSTTTPVPHLKAASALWRSNWLVLVQWDAVRAYDLAAMNLSSPVKTYTLPHPHDKWISYGFSPSGGLFHYTCAEGEGLSVYVLDIERGISKRVAIPIPAGKRVVSQLGDDWKLAVASYDPTSGVTYCALVDAATGEVRTEKLGPTSPSVRLKLLGGTAAVIAGGELVTVPRQQTAQQSGGAPVAYSVAVKVVDDAGAPLQGALVCANSTCATTDAGGTAAFELARGLYVLEVTHQLAEPRKVSLPVSGNLTVPLTVTRLFALTVSGTLGDGGRPPSCYIALVAANRSQNVTALNCTASFRVPRGSYRVVLQHGSQRVERSVEVRGDTVVLVQLGGGSVKLSVAAFNASGSPLPNAVITVLSDSGEKVASLSGSGEISVKPGRYAIRVEAPGYANWSAVVEVVGDAQLRAVLEPAPNPRAARALGLTELIAAVAASGAAGALAGALCATLGYCSAAHAQKLRRLKTFRATKKESG